MRIVASIPNDKMPKRRIVAADEEFDDFDDGFDSFDDAVADSPDMGDPDIEDQLDNIADDIDDLQEDVDDELEEDDPNIETDNNITDHYIAECEKCHGIFISAVIKSDQYVEKVTGTCPLCDKESDQYLKWVVEEVEAE